MSFNDAAIFFVRGNDYRIHFDIWVKIKSPNKKFWFKEYKWNIIKYKFSL